MHYIFICSQTHFWTEIEIWSHYVSCYGYVSDEGSC